MEGFTEGMQNTDICKTSDKILFDADAYPVKNAIVQVGTKFYVEILFVVSYAHRSRKQQGNWVYVDSEQDEVDCYIY